jgi:hypothetical protein
MSARFSLIFLEKVHYTISQLKVDVFRMVVLVGRN